MDENKNLTEESMIEEVNIDQDKPTTLSVRTKESLKIAFKEINGNTDNDKLIKLLELHEEFPKDRR